MTMKPETVSDTTEFNQIIVDISSSNCLPNTICTVFILIFAFHDIPKKHSRYNSRNNKHPLLYFVVLFVYLQ